jgi:predicted transcriptional regulator
LILLTDQTLLLLFYCFNWTQLLNLTEGHFAVTLNSKRTKLIRDVNMNAAIDKINERAASTMDDTTSSVTGVGEQAVVDLSPYVDRSTLTVQVGFPMSKVYTLFRSLGLRHLCVVNEEGAPVGILTRKELMCAFDRDLM